MAIVELHPDAQKRPYLLAGQYGPGAQHEADCEIVDYQFPAEETPSWDKENRENPDDWAFLRIQVKSDRGLVNIFHFEPISANSGSRLGNWLNAIGVPVEGDTFRHDTDLVVGRKCGVEMLDPRQDPTDPDKWYTGKVKNIFGVS